MIFTETGLEGAYIIDVERLEDERGFFARTWCIDEFRKFGLNTNLIECSISSNKKKGTLRGMHFQSAPHEEAKIVKCTRGEIFDVIVDLRRESSTFGKHFSVNLSATNHRMLYIPEGLAHGFQTLEDATEVFYQITERYYPESARGIRYDDPLLHGLKWPVSNPTISQRDLSFVNFE
ncbi:MAG: dTDP-4-dehydrorhamnose 3,5-epimerase [Candidatus Melainabacteria bacterium]|nr:dTDP-4-dehydrorhamnose 3,5-epimerase [Candidatus Melainabacteria bacterium]